MVAIAMMALALFSCKKNDEPKKAENAVLRICINDSALRALESEITAGTETAITSDVTIKLIPSGRKIALKPDQITAAKNLQEGCRIVVGENVEKVSLTANAVVTDDTAITDWQGKAATFTTEIPLTAPETSVTTTKEGENTIYKVTLEPKPAFARLEVAGKIVGQPSDSSTPKNPVNAFEDISVEAVYVNNYLNTRNAATRYFTEGEKGAFKAEPALQSAMMDEITSNDKEAFEKKTKVAGYQLFPIKQGEVAGPEFFDHVVLKLKITYSEGARVAGYPATATRFVTMVKFMEKTSGDLNSFEAGKIYKLDLAELSKDFKTSDDGTPDPDNPDTPNPEQEGKMLLNVKVKPYKWTTQNIKPDVNGGGYKK